MKSFFSLFLLLCLTSFAIAQARYGYVKTVRFSHNGKYVATGGADNTVKIWDVENKSLVKTIKDPDGVEYTKKQFSSIGDVSFSPDDKFIAIATSNHVLIFSVPEGKQIKILEKEKDYNEVDRVVYLSDGNTLLSIAYKSGIRIWDIANSKIIKTIKTKSLFAKMNISPDAKTLIVYGESCRVVQYWDIATWKKIADFKIDEDKLDEVTSARVSPDGNSLVLTGGHNNKPLIYNFQTKELIKTLELKGTFKSSIFSSDGKSVYISGGNSLYIVDLVTNTILKEFSNHSEGIIDAELSPNGKFIIVGCGNDMSKIWDIETGKEYATFIQNVKTLPSFKFNIIEEKSGVILSAADYGNSIIVKVQNKTSSNIIVNIKVLFECQETSIIGGVTIQKLEKIQRIKIPANSTKMYDGEDNNFEFSICSEKTNSKSIVGWTIEQ